MSGRGAVLHSQAIQSIQVPRFLWVSIRYRALIWELARREFSRRTRGAALGLGWWLLSPLILLGAYTFAFSYVLGVRWGVGAQDGEAAAFAMRLFTGLIVYQVFAAVVAGSTTLILSNEQYVKRVVLPLDVLSIVSLMMASCGWVFSYLALLVMTTIFEGLPPPTVLLAPILLLPVVLFAVGISWAVSALSVFVRDLQQVIQIALLVLLFLSPIFYPIELLEAHYAQVTYVHPLAATIEQIRACVFDPSKLGHPAWFVTLAGGFMAAWFGHALFQRLRPIFADVL